MTEQQIIRLAKEFFQCAEGPEIGDVVVTDDLIKDFASELLALQEEPTIPDEPILSQITYKRILISNDTIEKWAEAQSIGDIAFNEGCEHGAKSMQSGEIARWAKENET